MNLTVAHEKKTAKTEVKRAKKSLKVTDVFCVCLLLFFGFGFSLHFISIVFQVPVVSLLLCLQSGDFFLLLAFRLSFFFCLDFVEWYRAPLIFHYLEHFFQS